MDDTQHIEFRDETCNPPLSEDRLGDRFTDVLVSGIDITCGHRCHTILGVLDDTEENSLRLNSQSLDDL